jgi:hypothetical protein
VHLAAAVEQRPLRRRVALDHDDDARPDGQDVAALAQDLRLRHRDERHAPLRQQLVEPGGKLGQEDHGQIVGDRRDDRQEVQALGGAVGVGDVEHVHLAADEPGHPRRSRHVRAQRPADAEDVGPEPERVAAVGGLAVLEPADHRDVVLGRPLEHRRRLALAGRLAGAEPDHAAIGDEGRVERIGEIGTCGLGVELVDADSEVGEHLAEGVVLTLRLGQVDGVQEPVRWVVVGRSECRAGPLHDHVVKRRGHALGAVEAR